MADVTVAVRVKPGSSRTRVGGRHDGSLGPALIIAVTAPPVDGRATEAVRRALAEALGLPAVSVALRSGASGRDKLFTIADAPAGLTERVRTLRDGDAPRDGGIGVSGAPVDGGARGDDSSRRSGGAANRARRRGGGGA